MVKLGDTVEYFVNKNEAEVRVQLADENKKFNYLKARYKYKYNKDIEYDIKKLNIIENEINILENKIENITDDFELSLLNRELKKAYANLNHINDQLNYHESKLDKQRAPQTAAEIQAELDEATPRVMQKQNRAKPAIVININGQNVDLKLIENNRIVKDVSTQPGSQGYFRERT